VPIANENHGADRPARLAGFEQLEQMTGGWRTDADYCVDAL
jgi:hypothetical protein